MATQSIGDRVYWHRDQRGWTQEELAHEAGVSTATISHVESGAKRPRINTIRRLARAFDVSTDELLHGEELVHPLVEAPPELSLNDALAEERREATYSPVLEIVNRYADRWEAQIAAGDFDLGSAGEFVATVGTFVPTLRPLEVDEYAALPKDQQHEYMKYSKTSIAMSRLAAVFNALTDARASKLKNSELEQLRQEHAEEVGTIEDLMRRGA